MTCTQCHKLVDPYMEQEWLLVTIDCILMREEAYRHVLYNVDELKNTDLIFKGQCLVGWSVLDAYLKLPTEEPAIATAGLALAYQLTLLALTSALGFLVQCYILQKFPSEKGEGSMMFWAILLPLGFSLMTAFVSIWDDAPTVHTLASLLIAYWQWIAVGAITRDRQGPIVCLVVGTLWRLAVSSVLFYYEFLPCLGIEMLSINDQHLLCLS